MVDRQQKNIINKIITRKEEAGKNLVGSFPRKNV